MATYRYSGSPQFVTVATSGEYDIVAFGAQGGGTTAGGSGGLGAEVGGDVELTAGEKLEIIVGGVGGTSGSSPGGGGGGSFVLANIGGTYTPLIVAGGGGGGGGSGAYKVVAGGPGTTSLGDGQGGSAGTIVGGGGGSGVKSNGETGEGVGGGFNRSGNYAGGATNGSGTKGGFGGGGAGNSGYGGGGGGGYSGGFGGNGAHGGGYGGGGGSYDGGVPVADQTASGENEGAGRVVIFPNVVCFVTGTHIRTTRGDCAVEDLVAGDIAVTASGETRPVVWIGHRTMDCRGRHDLHPVRVAAHAFGAHLPESDLMLSPGHPVLVGADEDGDGGHLVPIMCLINGTTIRRVPVESVTYWHVELDQHDILLAEGLAAESYLDWGDRGFFTEGGDHALANPDFVVPGLAGRCRPVALDGPVVEAERRRLESVFAMQLVAACDWGGAEAALAF